MNINLIDSSLLIRSDGTIFVLDKNSVINKFLGIGKSCEEKAISFGQIDDFKWICTNKNLSLFNCAHTSWANKPLGKMSFSSTVDDYPNVFSVNGNVNAILVQGVDHLYGVTIFDKQINEFTIPNENLFFSGWWEGKVLYLAGMTRRHLVGDFPDVWGDPIILKIVGEDFEIMTPNIGLNIKSRQEFGIDKYLKIEGILDSINTNETVLIICSLISKMDDSYSHLLYKDYYLDFPILDDYGHFVIAEFKNGYATPVEYFSKNAYAGKICNNESVYCYFPDSSDRILNGTIPLSILIVDVKAGTRKIVLGTIKGFSDFDSQWEINFYRFLYDETIGFYGCLGAASIDSVIWFLLRSEDGTQWNVTSMEHEPR